MQEGPVTATRVSTKKRIGLALAGIFGVAVLGPAAYEAYKLNDLVWSAPEQGDIHLWRSGDVADYILSLDRNETFASREDFALKLNVMFREGSAVPYQVCIDTSYELAGIFYADAQSELAQRYITANPIFKNVVTESLERYQGEQQVNDRLSMYTHNDCKDGVKVKYADELAKVIAVRAKQLGL